MCVLSQHGLDAIFNFDADSTSNTPVSHTPSCHLLESQRINRESTHAHAPLILFGWYCCGEVEILLSAACIKTLDNWLTHSHPHQFRSLTIMSLKITWHVTRAAKSAFNKHVKPNLVRHDHSILNAFCLS